MSENTSNLITEPVSQRPDYILMIRNASEFVKSVTSYYGSEDGMALWERMTEVLDPEVKFDLFQVMIGAKTLVIERALMLSLDPIHDDLFRGNTNNYFIPLIKAIRRYSGASLKDAKGMADRLTGRGGGHMTVKLKLWDAKNETVSDSLIDSAVREFRDFLHLNVEVV